MLQQLPDQKILREDVQLLWQAHAAATVQEDAIRRRLEQHAKNNEVIRRFAEMPGIAWVRAATLYVFLDTPWRFRSKAALWKYLGIGLERRGSGAGPVRLQVPKRVNRLLKSTILGAAKTAAAREDNPFAVQYRRYIEAGLTKRLARQCRAQPGRDALGPVEKWQRLPLGLGGRGCGRDGCGRGVSVTERCFLSGGGVPTGGLDPLRRSPWWA